MDIVSPAEFKAAAVQVAPGEKLPPRAEDLVFTQIAWPPSPAFMDLFMDPTKKIQAVMQATSLAEAEARINRPDRRVYALHAPNNPDDFHTIIQVALHTGFPRYMEDITNPSAPVHRYSNTAIPYAIESRKGAAQGAGSILIERVAQELWQSVPHLEEIPTFSPIPGWRKDIANALEDEGKLNGRQKLIRSIYDEAVRLTGNPQPSFSEFGKIVGMQSVDDLQEHDIFEVLPRFIAGYVTAVHEGEALDGVAKFHVGRNGARVERVIVDKDDFRASYRYMPDMAEAHLEKYREGKIATSPAVDRMLARDPYQFYRGLIAQYGFGA
ncbi:MAG TPA: malonyl-CoA decarboxylase family protein [Alphaproteobacteria bacterium]|nr:malonyl-CoA decarboxylase family protein [Alphaproteobacteria bacterium]